ncbi:hypothetical protein ACTS95_15600 [Empedobacter brevis]|uniref:Uncharacterized protein n=1 Tax=Empedobacter brevis NBRC 14943 = ATCC 43319 TaxID=1218108 RepID=A0A511NGQ1_9FLAO|nr:hypothetical protein [Empedobacter brevis]GEM51984.1 hypothetical protein EB1_17740 [Empedobacter brevis NBRC 14943 = ATCC 43319]
MNPELKEIEKQIKKTHKFAFTPKYKTEFHTQLSGKAFFAITNQAFEKLEWDIIYVDEHSIEAKRKTKSLGMTQYTESIIVSYNYGNVAVKSESLGNEMWDNGRNSKRVHLFIQVIQDIERNYNREELRQLEKEQESKDNWDDYKIPTELPKPKAIRKPNIIFPILIAIVSSIILAFILAKISLTGRYIIVLFEFLVGLALAFSLKLGIKLGNFTNFNKLINILICSILIVFIGNQIFQYNIILTESNFERIGFFEFLKLRLQQGLTIKSLNVGSVGLIISWIIQLGLTFVFGYLNLTRFLISYVIKRIPTEVIDFTFFHFVKGKDEHQVRTELAFLGWTNEQNQNEVFEAINGIQENNEMNRTT